MGDCGVCIGGCDGDTPEIYNERMVRARKVHKCCECEREILVGAVYEKVSGRWEGEFGTYKFCADCSDIGKSLSCGEGRTFLNLWDDIEENLFPNMTRGCINKLQTASAKVFLVKRWNEWKFGKAS